LNEPSTILVTGATGYVGGQLVPRLLEAGHHVRVLARDPARLQDRTWSDQVEVVQGDVLDPDTLQETMAGIRTAYYLIHSMMAGADFHQRDLSAARNFSRAAQHAGVELIIYLGGLGDPDSDLSHHLRSRQLTGASLREEDTPVLEFRAGVIVGVGSLSFEMIRYLTERVPVMICPRWVFTRTQPISINNVLDYLVAALALPLEGDRTIDIGGPEVLSYGDMVRGYAQARGLKRWIVPVPVLTPRLSSHWVQWVTPIPATIARPLIDGLRNEAVVREDSAASIFPSIRLLDYATAVRNAIAHLDAGEVVTATRKIPSTSIESTAQPSVRDYEGMIIERYQQRVQALPANVFQAFTGLGGERGWLYADWAWRLRGGIDRVVGGIGFRRGRPDPNRLQVGDALDFWRVDQLEPARSLRLKAEMKLPGHAWLQFEAIPLEEAESLLVQTTCFAPKGLLGLLYWTFMLPFHRRISVGLLHALRRESVLLQRQKRSHP
jgi:uncharacterized protein YbjT (DUF2867 family)